MTTLSLVFLHFVCVFSFSPSGYKYPSVSLERLGEKEKNPLTGSVDITKVSVKMKGRKRLSDMIK